MDIPVRPAESGKGTQRFVHCCVLVMVVVEVCCSLCLPLYQCVCCFDVSTVQLSCSSVSVWLVGWLVLIM